MTQCWNLGAISINSRQMVVEQAKPVQGFTSGHSSLSDEQKDPEKKKRKKMTRRQQPKDKWAGSRRGHW